LRPSEISAAARPALNLAKCGGKPSPVSPQIFNPGYFAYGAHRICRQAAGRSAILSPGFGFDGGEGLGWSTASVNQ
jgi:hypothetical protein